MLNKPLLEGKHKIQWARDNPSLCFAPYESIDIRLPNHLTSADDYYQKIRVTCCCNLESPIVSAPIPADLFVDIKQSMDRGVLPIECKKCQNEEKNNGISERIRTILSKEYEEELSNFSLNREVISYELKVLTSNICSLACRSCNEGSSSTYAKISKNTSNNYLEKDITEIDAYWDLITNTVKEKFNSHTQFYIHLMGGEPLLHAGSRKILNWLVDQGYASKTNIRITTSLNVELKQDLLDLFNKFQEIQFILSIDSVGENYHYVRWPAKFSKIEHNLATLMLTQKFNTRKTNYKNLILSPVFSLNNIFYIKDYLDFWYNWSKENEYCMFFLHTNLVEQTNHLDIEALPVKYRSTLINILNDCSNHPIISSYPDQMQHLQHFIQTTISELTHRPDDMGLWGEFLEYTAEFDIRTNTKFENFNDRLYNLLGDNDKKLFNTKLSLVNPTTTLLHRYFK